MSERAATPPPPAAASRGAHALGLLRRWLGIALPWICILAPAIVTARLMHLHLVNIPFLDDWMFTPMFDKVRKGTLTLHDMFAVQMEHRLAWPRLVILALDGVLPGKFTAQCWVSYALLVGCLLNSGILLRRTGLPWRQRWPMLTLFSICLFTPALYQILLWPMMFQVITPVWGLLSALVVLGCRRWPAWLRFVLCVFFAEAASMSLASGLLVWALVAPVILWTDAFASQRGRMVFFGSWLAAFAVTAVLYFHNLKNEADPQFAYRAGQSEVTVGKGLSMLIQDPGHFFQFALRFAGGHLCRGTSGSMLGLAMIFGSASVLGLLLACLHWLRHFRDREWRAQAIPWIALGTYTLGTGCMVAVGRAWASQNGDNALTARYVIHCIPLTLALIVLAWLLVQRSRGLSWSHRAFFAAKSAAVGLVIWQIVAWTHGAQMMGVWKSARLRGAANTLFFKLAGDVAAKPERKSLINARAHLCSNEGYAVMLDDLGLLNPPMLKTDKVADAFRSSRKQISLSTAAFRMLQPTAGGKLRARGHAQIPGVDRVADALLFTYIENDQHTIFHVAQVDELPLFMEDSIARDLRFTMHSANRISQHLAAFDVEIPLSSLPAGKHDVFLWLLDYEKWTVYLAPGRFRVDTKAREVWARSAAVPPSDDDDAAPPAKVEPLDPAVKPED